MHPWSLSYMTPRPRRIGWLMDATPARTLGPQRLHRASLYTVIFRGFFARMDTGSETENLLVIYSPSQSLSVPGGLQRPALLEEPRVQSQESLALRHHRHGRDERDALSLVHRRGKACVRAHGASGAGGVHAQQCARRLEEPRTYSLSKGLASCEGRVGGGPQVRRPPGEKAAARADATLLQMKKPPHPSSPPRPAARSPSVLLVRPRRNSMRPSME